MGGGGTVGSAFPAFDSSAGNWFFFSSNLTCMMMSSRVLAFNFCFLGHKRCGDVGQC